MRLIEYQYQAVRTAIYPHTHKLIYPALGLCGEVGELIGYVSAEQGLQLALVLDNIKKEIGDVLWYAANVAEDMDVLLCEVMEEEDFPKYTGPWDADEVIGELPIHAGVVAENVKKTIRDSNGALSAVRRDNIVLALRWVLRWVARLCSNYNITLEECAQLNLDKLRSRAERGVLKGDGDDR